MARGQVANIGERFGRLIVIRSGFRAEPTPAQINRVINGVPRPMPGNLRCEVLCDCGNIKIVKQHALRTGETKSCGCLQKETSRIAGRANKTHGMRKHPQYSRWNTMMGRCYNPTNHKYPRYGARGIGVHSAWHDVREFCSWIDTHLGPCPKDYSLDRIDNDGNYEPGNVRWADAITQSNNK